MAKNLDGIIKLNPEDVKKYRQAVLNYIGEKDEPAVGPKPAKQTRPPWPNVDGLKVNKINDLEAAVKKQAEAKIRRAEQKSWQEKIRLEAKEQAEKRLAEENLRREKIKRRAEAEKIKAEVRLAKNLAAAKRKIKRQLAIKKLKKKLMLGVRKIVLAVKRNLSYGLWLLVIFLAISYLVFCLAVLRFKAAGGLAQTLTRYLPVPAVLNNYGFISYNDYLDLADKNYSKQALIEKKKSLAEWTVMRNLKQKYNLPLGASKEELAIKFTVDEAFNRVGLARIKKINQLLAGGEKIEQLSKSADEYNSAAYYGLSQTREKFGEAVLSLAAGQASGIIYRPDGYYLVKKINDQNNQLGFQSIFVGALTLDQYLNEKSAKAKVFILAN